MVSETNNAADLVDLLTELLLLTHLISSIIVIFEFVKISFEFLRKGANPKLYVGGASKKMEDDVVCRL
jgi:hypothetical protein